jgi:hypothetical protein
LRCALLLSLLLACTRSTAPVDNSGAPDSGNGNNPDAGPTGCIGSALLQSLGKQHLLIGASMSDASASAAPWDGRYEYLAGGLFDSSTPCPSCATNCSAAGHSCANAAGGCGWWGCFQYDLNPPGEFARDFVSGAGTLNLIPMFTYYEILQASGVAEGTAEVTQAATNAAFMTRYLGDFRFLLQQIGSKTAFVQIEPDFWGYAQHVNADPHQIPAAVSSANPADCGAQENSLAGLGKCLVAMARKYAPNVRIGLHASSWGPGLDALLNTDTTVDIAAQGAKLGAFMAAAGASDADFVTVDASDRDAGYYASISRNTFWDATNAKLPNFHQAFAWAKAVAEQVGRPIVWWQVPVGNMAQNNTTNHWQDNRVDYFFAHTAELAAAHSAAVFFGAGAGGQTTPETDGGNLLAQVRAYAAAGGQALCQ